MVDDAFINPELELQMHQSNLDNEPEFDAMQLRQSISKTDDLLGTLKDDTESLVALESMRDFIKDKRFDKTSAILFNVAVEGYGNLNKLPNTKPAFGLESLDQYTDVLSEQDKLVAMENMAENAKVLMNSLVASLNNTMQALGDIVHGFDRQYMALKKRVALFEVMLEQLEGKDELVYNYVKPEKQYVHLMYTVSGAKDGIKPVMNDINWLLKEHASMVSDSVGKYKRWFYDHRNNVDNTSVFNSLDFRRQDFLLSGSTVFNKTVGNKSAGKDHVFYRTKELPGGKSFYTKVNSTDTSGLDAVNALMDVNYFMDYYAPDSFRITEKRLYSVATLGVLTWASVMVANPLPLVFAGLAMSAVNESTKVSDMQKVRISEDSVFPTLGKEELIELLESSKQALANLDRWNKTVYHEVWKDQSIKQAIDQISQQANESGNTTASRYMKNYAVALISLMSKSYTKMHAYSFNVLNAALSYGEKSVRLYR
jgi:hypothetical protein